jgi:hypothetical protein
MQFSIGFGAEIRNVYRNEMKAAIHQDDGKGWTAVHRNLSSTLCLFRRPAKAHKWIVMRYDHYIIYGNNVGAFLLYQIY